MTFFLLLLLALESMLQMFIVNLVFISLFRNSYFLFHKVFSVFANLFVCELQKIPTIRYCWASLLRWQTKQNRTSSFNEKHLPVGVFWSHCWLSISSLGEFVLVWWVYVWIITRHDIRSFYIFQIWRNTCFTWLRENQLQVGVFLGFRTKYKFIIFIDLWFYLNKW